MVALWLMRAYKVSLLKWFACITVVMVWCSVTLAKFLTPFAGDLVFNPGGRHGLYCVGFSWRTSSAHPDWWWCWPLPPSPSLPI